MDPTPLPTLADLLTSQAQLFLQPSKTLHETFLNVAKEYLDPLALKVTKDEQAREQHERKASKKRKRKGGQVKEELLRMKRVHVQGFEVEQVWAQARRVLDHACKGVEKGMPEFEDEDLLSADGEEGSWLMNVEEDEDDESLGEEGVDWKYEDPALSSKAGQDELDEDSENESQIEDEEESFDDGSDGIGDETPPSDVEDAAPTSNDTAVAKFRKDKFGLNDGYFSIDDFNKQTQFLEQIDANGDSDDGRASDEEDVDWELDPFTVDPRAGGAKATKSGRKRRQKDADEDEDEDEDEDDGDGPTFGNMDLDAPEGDSEDGEFDEEDMGDMGDFGNANSIMASDFWGGPKPSKKGRPQMNGRQKDPDRRRPAEDVQQEDDIERTMSAVHRDLFDDEQSAYEDEDEDEVQNGAPGRNLSTHEKAQLALRKEIRRLEAENVANKHWSLTGETQARARPENALLEEDLDFERAGKPVPIITSEVNESIEDLIKRRIIAKEFDELIRRKPTDLIPGGQEAGRRGRLEEVSDTKSKVGLADEYEADYLRRTDPNYVDTRSAALKAKHAEIETQWASISAQLDALSNWHYKPRPAAASMDVRVDVPTIAMEDARPSVNGLGNEASTMAPQDIYKPGDEKGKRDAGEVITKGGTAVAKEEESREARRSRRSRQKERLRKSISNETRKLHGTSLASKSKSSQGAADKNEVLGQLKRGGVKVINRKGEVTDVAGKGLKKSSGAAAIGSFKL